MKSLIRSISFRVLVSTAQFVGLLFGSLLFGDSQNCRADFPLRDNDRVLFIGDSITQDGRYVDLVQGYIWAQYPDRQITIINAGLSSETVSGITEPIHPFPRPNILDRLDRILQLSRPDFVFVCYGMNDGIYHPVEPRITEAYRQGLKSVLAKIDAAGAKAYLLSPPVFDVSAPSIQKNLANAKKDEPYGYRRPFEQYDMTLVTLTNIVQDFENDPRVAGYIDVHASTHDFLKAAKEADPNFVYGDGVHPPLEGHAAMARAVLFGLGESEIAIEQTMARYMGIQFPESKSNELPAGEDAGKVRELLFKRGRALSSKVRELVSPKSDGSGINEFSDSQTVQEANAAKTKIVEMIEAMKKHF